jgi:D-alanyl-D-alanine carboxypeptidase
LLLLWKPAGVVDTPNTGDAVTSGITDSAGTSAPPVTDAAPPVKLGRSVPVSSDGVKTGELLLITANQPYTFPAGTDTPVMVWGNKSSNYLVANTSITLPKSTIKLIDKMLDDMYAATGIRDIQITSGYRTREDQLKIIDDFTETRGAEYAATYAALPGFSEHHTGLAFDCNVYHDSKTYTLDEAVTDVSEDYGWLMQNAPKYGFILRYPKDKVSITGIAYEPWHFRYVGIPHAEYMQANNLCFEEYISLLFSHTYENEHLEIETSSGDKYEVYYIPVPLTEEVVPVVTEAPSTDIGTDTTTDTTVTTSAPKVIYKPAAKTTIYVPDGKEYTISGNNSDGFIITVKN